MNQMSRIKDVTNSPKDWEDFWNEIPEENKSDLKQKSKYYFDYDRNDLNKKNTFKK